jgi:hypothetical protein
MCAPCTLGKAERTRGPFSVTSTRARPSWPAFDISNGRECHSERLLRWLSGCVMSGVEPNSVIRR